jgi:hypothetical protein
VKHLADLGRNPSIELHSLGRDNLMYLVAMGRGLTLTSEATKASNCPRVVYRPLANEILPFCAIWSSDSVGARSLPRRWTKTRENISLSPIRSTTGLRLLINRLDWGACLTGDKP